VRFFAPNLPPLHPPSSARLTACFASQPHSATASAPAAGPAPYLERLSAEQTAAVLAPLGATRVVAGPGSGKTRVLTSRIAHLIAAHGAQPWQIVAITFTNKAADEMKERLLGALGAAAKDQLFAGTFHGLCYRILRRGLEALPDTGRTEDWSLYDEEAAQAVMYKIVKSNYPDWKGADVRDKAKSMLSAMSQIKNSLCYVGLRKAEIVDAFYRRQAGGQLNEKEVVRVREVTEYFER
jgi:DNA helicase II / ATP-dependent DNA helicase PcrA